MSGSGPSGRRTAPASLVVLIAIAPALSLPPQARSAPTARQTVNSPQVRRLADDIAEPWSALQRPDGSFADYMAQRGNAQRDLYGEAMLGYGLLHVGIREGDDRRIRSGLRALTAAARSRRSYHSMTFEQMALASAYNLARERIADHPMFRDVRRSWEARIRRFRPIWIGRHRGNFFNQYIVDAVGVLETARSGLRSDLRGTVSSNPGRAVAQVERLLNGQVHRLLAPHTSRLGRAGRITMASDGPIAYHALTAAFYGRAIRLLGARGSGSSHRFLHQLARASWALMAPDGDVAYFGRSEEQSWALALTAYAAESGAPFAGPTWAPRYRALADRALRRLGALHGGGRFGLHLTPAFALDFRSAMFAQDDYVSGPSYTGLTLVGLNWALERRRAFDTDPGLLAADRRIGARIGGGAIQFAVAANGRQWYALRLRPGRYGDLRDDSGLVALKVRDPRGRWRDVLAHRPRTMSRRDTAGPVLIRGHARGVPVGNSLTVRRGASILLRARMVGPGGRLLSRSARVAFVPSGCGLRIRAPGRRGDRWEYSALVAPPVRHSGRTVEGGNQRVVYRGAGHLTPSETLLGPVEPRLSRQRISVRRSLDTVISSRAGCGRPRRP
jgi:hypothetical protein